MDNRRLWRPRHSLSKQRYKDSNNKNVSTNCSGYGEDAIASYIRQRPINDEYNLIGIAEYSRMSLKKPQFEALTYNKMRPVDAKALPIIAFALTGRIVLLGFILCVGRE